MANRWRCQKTEKERSNGLAFEFGILGKLAFGGGELAKMPNFPWLGKQRIRGFLVAATYSAEKDWTGDRRRRTGGGEGLEIGARENKIAGKKKTARGARNSFALKKNCLSGPPRQMPSLICKVPWSTPAKFDLQSPLEYSYF